MKASDSCLIRIVRAVLGRRLFGSLARVALIDISHLDVLARDVLNLAGKLADLGAVLIGGLTRSTSRWPSIRLPHAASSPSSAWQTVEDSTQRGSKRRGDPTAVVLAAQHEIRHHKCPRLIAHIARVPSCPLYPIPPWSPANHATHRIWLGAKCKTASKG